MDEIRKLADAVLYEGYVLWPYRRSAPKNRSRWTFGCVFPPAWNDEHPDDLAEIRAECLLEHDDPDDVDVSVRFLHAVDRRLRDDGSFVDELVVGGERHLAWNETTERELAPGPIDVPAGCDVEALGGGAEVVRTWNQLHGRVDAEVDEVADGRYRVGVRVANETEWTGGDREDALSRAFCSAHVVLRTSGGAFVSPTEDTSGLCTNVGVWPVLVGAEGDRTTILASPIVLSDYPQIAPESPGDLFDAGEIDRLLILNVLALTREEQEEMRATDPRTREILDRCAALGADELLPLHGVIRDFRPGEP